MILTDSSLDVLACAQQVGESMSSVRQVAVGRPYKLPPVVVGLPPSSCIDREEWQTTLCRAAELAASQEEERRQAKAAKSGSTGPAVSVLPSLVGGFTRAFQAVSPGLVDEWATAAGTSLARSLRAHATLR